MIQSEGGHLFQQAAGVADTGEADEGNGRTKVSRSERTRARILDAAERVFGARGYHGASIVEITRDAGVGLGTFYLYFPSKLEIYRHLLRSRQEEFIAAARAAAAGSGDDGDRKALVRASFREFFDWIGKRPTILRLLREAEFVDPSLLVDLYQRPAEEYRMALAVAMDKGYMPRTDPDVLAWCLMGMAEFTVLRWLVWTGRSALAPDQFDAFVDIVLRIVSNSERPA